MVTRGRVGKCCGKVDAKRHTKTPRTQSLISTTSPYIRRLDRRGSVTRLSSLIYEASIGVLRSFPENVVRDSVIHTKQVRRNTDTAIDVVHAIRDRTGPPQDAMGGHTCSRNERPCIEISKYISGIFYLSLFILFIEIMGFWGFGVML